MPHGRAEGSEEFEEERRVAYVAATRAQERLVFTSSTQYQLELTSSESGLTWDQYLSSRTESDRP